MKILKGIAAAQGLVFGKMIYFEKNFDNGANEIGIDEAAEKALEKVRYLHKKTLDTCFTHECRRLTSTIVSNNAKVLRVYVNAGATISDTLYTYVKHVKR